MDVSNHGLDGTGLFPLKTWISFTLLLEHVSCIAFVVLKLAESMPVFSGSPDRATEKVLAMVVPQRFVRIGREEVDLEKRIADLAFKAIKCWSPEDDDSVLLNYTDHLCCVVMKAAFTKATITTRTNEVQEI
jgi:hypothetical protein